jgi:hypothetical protein
MPESHTVKEGDSVIRLADTYGFFALTIWNWPDNSALRSQREDMNVLMPGDIVVIPDKRLGLEKRPTGKMHRFRRKGIPAIFRMQIFDMHTPRANQQYTLTVDGVVQKGVTDGEGILERYIPAQAHEGELVIGEDQLHVPLQFGYLDPLSEISGVQKRLNNLGYDCGLSDGTLNDQTRFALTDFQRDSLLPITGDIDAATRAKLEEVHDKPYQYPDSDSGSGK